MRKDVEQGQPLQLLETADEQSSDKKLLKSDKDYMPLKELSQEEKDQILLKYPAKPKNRRTPYGYILISQESDGDPNLVLEGDVSYTRGLLIPDPEVIFVLDQAFDQLDAGVSYRLATDFLNYHTPEGCTLSHVGLKKLHSQYREKLTKKNKPLRRLTPEEKAQKRRRLLIAQEKKRITNAQKRTAKLEEEISIIEHNKVLDKSLMMELDYSSPELQEIEQEVSIIFKPNPGPQTTFFAAEEQEVLFGGAAGGGKSYAMIADPMRYFDNKNFRGLILRRTNDELRELIWKSQELYPQIFVGSVWREKDKEWRFPSGARLWMTYLERDEDVMRYHGQAFTYIGIDELTQYATPFAWDFMRSRLRDASGTLPLYMRATSNPGGPGHGWVKRMFIDPAPHGQAFWATDIETKEVLSYPKGHSKEGQPLFQRRFIPSKVSDNPYIWKDGGYEANLLSLPEEKRRQLLYGDWDVADGAAFSEFRQSIHVIEPFDIPKNWIKFRSCDFGYSTRQASAVHWYAIHPATAQLIVYREFYVNQHTGRELARKVLRLEANDTIAYGVLDSSCWAVRGQTGPSIAEEMIAEGCRWKPSDRTAGSRIAGKNRLHELLRVDPFSKLPGIVFFNTCRQIISDIPVIPSDKDSDDIDPKYASDHAYDSIRYGIMSRPKSTEYIGLGKSPSSFYRPSDMSFGY